ncbi:MAG: hypothetical protein QXT25_02650 [Candidatus Anstonellaceae archaeon]
MQEHQILLAFSFLILLIPSITFLLNSNGLLWDLPGHIAEVKVFQQLFPNIYGWNHYFLFGYPIYLYPPGSRLIAIPFSYFIGAENAVKLLLAIFCVGIPFSIYLFLSNRWMDKTPAAYVTFLISLFMVTINSPFSLTLYSAYFVGLYANFVAVFFFFLSLAYLHSDWRLCGLFGALTLLSNLVAGLSLFIFLTALFLSRDKIFNDLNGFILSCLIISGLSAFWLLPFFYESFLSGFGGAVFETDLNISNITEKFFISLLGLLISLFYFYLLSLKTSNYPYLFIGLFCVILILDILVTITASYPLLVLPSSILFLSSPFIAILSFSEYKSFVKFLSLVFILFFSLQCLWVIVFSSSSIASLIYLHTYRILSFIEVFHFIPVGIAIHKFFGQQFSFNQRILAILLFPLIFVFFHLLHFSQYTLHSLQYILIRMRLPTHTIFHTLMLLVEH